MREHTIGEGLTLYLPDGFARNGLSKNGLERHAKRIKSGFVSGPQLRDFLTAFGTANELEGCVILDATGKDLNGKWGFEDIPESGREFTTVQSFINYVDGDAPIIMLNLGNPEDRKIESRHSIVMHLPRGQVPSVNYRGPLRIFVPGKGYVEGGKMEKRIFVPRMVTSRAKIWKN